MMYIGFLALKPYYLGPWTLRVRLCGVEEERLLFEDAPIQNSLVLLPKTSTYLRHLKP